MKQQGKDSFVRPTEVVVHSGMMHADDVMTVALLTAKYPDIKVTRSFAPTQEQLDDSAIYVCDVGKEYDSSKNNYDHHNECPNRSDGTPHSAVGLVIKDVFKGDIPESMQRDIDMIEHIDCGRTDENYNSDEYNLINFVGGMNPTWNSTDNPDDRFMQAVKLIRENYVVPMMRGVVPNETELRKVYEEYSEQHKQAAKDAEDLVIGAYDKSVNKITVLPQYAPFQSYLYDKDSDFVIFPSNRGGYVLQCVPQGSPDSFEVKSELPDWTGNLPKGCSFQYNRGTRFMASFDTQENAINAALEVQKLRGIGDPNAKFAVDRSASADLEFGNISAEKDKSSEMTIK